VSYETPIDRAIREATERGAFDNLPGAGKPLPLRNTSDPDWWLKDLMARESISGSEVLPPALALRREADGFPESLADLPTEDAVRAVLVDFNTRVEADWRRPGVGRGSPVVARRVDVETLVEQWRAQREGRAGSERPAGNG
jgi:hypothetical protein